MISDIECLSCDAQASCILCNTDWREAARRSVPCLLQLLQLGVGASLISVVFLYAHDESLDRLGVAYR